MSQYYKVTNISDHPVHLNWNKALLSDEDLEKYEAYKLTPDYLGYTLEDQSMRKKIAEETKTRAFFSDFGKDLRVKVVDRAKLGKYSASLPRYEWHFCIGPDIKFIIKQDNLTRTRQTCELYDIQYSPRDTLEQLTKKMLEHFGSNERVLTVKQWSESGLKDELNKKLEVKQKNGSEIKIVNTGRLEVAELSDTEAFEYLQLNQDNSEMVEEIIKEQPGDGKLRALEEQIEELKLMINSKHSLRAKSRVKKSFIKTNE